MKTKFSWLVPLVMLANVAPWSVRASDKFEFPLAVSSKVLGFGPAWVADKKGFFAREGLDVVVTTTRGTSPAMQALAAESVHAALASNDGVIGLVEKGLDLAIIAGGSKTTHMIMGGKDIKSFEDLRGKVVGSSTLTSGTAFLLRRVLKEKGLEYLKDYALVNVGGSGPAMIAISTGKVAAGILSVPIAFRAQDIGMNLIGKVADVFPNYLLSSFSVRRQWAAENRPQVVKFLRALLNARKWLESDRDQAAEFLAAELQTKKDNARKGLDYYIDNRAWEPDLGVDVGGLKAVVEIYAEQAALKGPVPDAKKYVDMSYLQTAIQELGWK